MHFNVNVKRLKTLDLGISKYFRKQTNKKGNESVDFIALFVCSKYRQAKH
jgi:hypothetical protein